MNDELLERAERLAELKQQSLQRPGSTSAFSAYVRGLERHHEALAKRVLELEGNLRETRFANEQDCTARAEKAEAEVERLGKYLNKV